MSPRDLLRWVISGSYVGCLQDRVRSKGPKRHQAVSGYWHTLSTLAAYCRVRSYLISARGHNIRSIDAIHNALTGNPWLPTPATARHHSSPVNGHLDW